MFGDRTPATEPRDEPESDRRGRVPLALVALALALVAVILGGRRGRESTLEPPF